MTIGSGPLHLNVADLLRHPGTRREVRRSVPLDDLVVSAAAVPAGAEVAVDLVLESLSNAIVVTGTIDVPWVGECRRCLGEVEGVSAADVREVFERTPSEGDTYPLVGDQVDLEPVIRDAALLALPLAPLCQTDCRGPAPDEFPATVESEDTGKDPDPRWAALDDLKFDE